jgi:hypothetical protein
MGSSTSGFTAGVRLRLSGLPPFKGLQDWAVDDWMAEMRSRSVASLSYAPPGLHAKSASSVPPVKSAVGGNSSRFAASLELVEDRNLVLSFFQHLAQVALRSQRAGLCQSLPVMNCSVCPCICVLYVSQHLSYFLGS